MSSILITTRIAAPAERCFALSLSIDAHTDSMRQSSERAVAGVTHGEIGLGETVTWSARHFGIRFRMTSIISEYERPVRFVDEQTAGPFARWWHEHEFLVDEDEEDDERDNETTLMIDRIEFDAPFGFLGRLVEWVILTRYMERLIRRRNSWLKRELEAKSPRRR